MAEIDISSMERPDTGILPGELLAAKSEKPCPECGEKVRQGLVRCWNCGAFMNRALEAKFQEMQSKPREIMLSAVPEGEAVDASGQAEDDDDDDDEAYTLAGPSLDLGPQPNAPITSIPSIPRPTPAAPKVPTPASSTPSFTAVDNAPKLELKPLVKEGEKPPEKPVDKDAPETDALLSIALKDEAELAERRKRRKTPLLASITPGRFLIYCPYGCRVEVKDQHRGMTGKCPRCKAPFIVPTDPPQYAASKKEVAAGAVPAPVSQGFKQSMHDLHLHVVSPEKLKLKADSLLKEFVEVDLGFDQDGLWMLTLFKKAGGLFGGGGGGDKKQETRDAILKHLTEGNPATAMPAADKRQFTIEQLKELRVVQPVANRAMSMFAGVPVFGTGRIAVQLPINDSPDPQYLTFGLLEFRKFVAALNDLYQITGLGQDSGLPQTDTYVDFKCHYNSSVVRSLQNLEYYQADPTSNLVLSGWQCVACSLVMSEEGRAKETFGGKGGKGIAKAKCPKCKQKYGERPLYSLPASAESSADTPPTAAAASPSDATAPATTAT